PKRDGGINGSDATRRLLKLIARRSCIPCQHFCRKIAAIIPVRSLPAKGRRKMTYFLWTVQALLALVFLFAGGVKLVIPPDVLMSMGPPNQVQLPGLFLQFIGVAEVL